MYRPFRLTGERDFRRTREHGRAYRDGRLVMLVRPNDLEISRFGFVTSGHIGGAVQRNALRRLMREAARVRIPGLPAGYDIVVIATRQAVGASYQEIDASMQALLERAGLSGERA